MPACLIRKKGNKKQVCVACFGDGTQGVDLFWEDYKNNLNCLFASAKQAWWAWYQYRKHHPESIDGWYAQVEMTK